MGLDVHYVYTYIYIRTPPDPIHIMDVNFPKKIFSMKIIINC